MVLGNARFPLDKVCNWSFTDQVKRELRTSGTERRPVDRFDPACKRLTIRAVFVGFWLLKISLPDWYCSYTIDRNGKIVLPRWADQLI